MLARAVATMKLVIFSSQWADSRLMEREFVGIIRIIIIGRTSDYVPMVLTVIRQIQQE